MSTVNQDSGLQLIRRAVEHAAHLLPMQGPIGVFIHHNTLHAFQHLPFEQAVVEAAGLFGAEPFMSEEQYRREFERGRILLEDLEAVLPPDQTDFLLSGCDRRTLRLQMLYPGLPPLDGNTVRWAIDEGQILRGPGDRALFDTCLRRTEPVVPSEPAPGKSRLRDHLLAVFGVDLDDVVNPLLIRFCGAFFDQGLAYWPMPERERGFYAAVRELWMQPGGILPEHLRQLPDEFHRQAAANWTSEQAVERTLEKLRMPPERWEASLISELLALPGWAGLMSRLEAEPELAPHEALRCSLMDFLAVRLTLTVVAAQSVAGGADNLYSSTPIVPETSAEDARLLAAARLFQLARAMGISSSSLEEASADSIRALCEEIDAFSSLERRKTWHLAYERRHERMILGPLGTYRSEVPPIRFRDRPVAQVFFCIDEREESIRRQLEEIAPDFETFGAAGFFGIAVDYAGIDDAHGVPLCPVVVKPQHAVREVPVDEHGHLHARRRALRALWARSAHHLSWGSRTLVRGAVSTAVLGLFSLFPLVTHVLSPRRYSLLSRALNRWILPEPRTELTLMRTDKHGHDVAEHLLLGFTLEEKAERVASVLRPAGLVEVFSRIVIVLGHGSTSLNNPHESAHDCGACGGRRGGPNGRLFAAMANHPEVRQRLRVRGIAIPADTWFVGGYHDTCSDEIDYFDVEALPEELAGDFQAAREVLDRARALDAHERSRRFEAAPANPSPAAALWHVQERSEHLAEPRPEYGHCTNAVCIVGRRSVTRGLFLDRRAFLVSYDPLIDPEGENLARVLGAVIPVCAGISLEYYFSYVDNEVYGCGTKLPHNITGLVGIMNGYASDLRTGLPWQMVEIHEPVRILFTVEAEPDVLKKVILANSLLTEFVQNCWIRLSSMHPITGEIRVYRDGRFEASEPWESPIPEAPTSAEWYKNTREHLPIAYITGSEIPEVAGA